MTRAAASGLRAEDLRVEQWRRLLGAYDYQRQLERGYSVTRDASGAVVRTVNGLSPGTALHTLVSDGQVSSTVTAVEARGTMIATIRMEGWSDGDRCTW